MKTAFEELVSYNKSSNVPDFALSRKSMVDFEDFDFDEEMTSTVQNSKKVNFKFISVDEKIGICSFHTVFLSVWQLNILVLFTVKQWLCPPGYLVWALWEYRVTGPLQQASGPLYVLTESTACIIGRMSGNLSVCWILPELCLVTTQLLIFMDRISRRGQRCRAQSPQDCISALCR